MAAAAAARTGIFIVGAKRTAFGAFGGSFKDLTATDLATHAAQAALSHAKLDPKLVDSVIIGNVQQTSSNAAYLARHVGLRVGGRIDAPALIVNRLCGSGFQSMISGAHEILTGDADIVMTGGTESMSQAPFAVRGVRFGTALGAVYKFDDTLWEGLSDEYCKTPMGVTAENLADDHAITREDCDKYSLASQQRWLKAHKEGLFAAEIAPVTVKTKKGDKVVDTDEGPKPQTTIEGLQKLPSVFKKAGRVTAGGASGISDGAAVNIIASEAAVKKHNLTPLARILSWQVSGVPPTHMGIGPVPAIQGALKKAGLTLADMDLVEVNEAFAAQYLAVEKVLGLSREKTNACGGAIALGHPLGASGARIMAHLTHQLQRTKGKRAVGGACIGGGQGIAIVIERV